MFKASDVMTTTVVTVRMDTSIAEAVDLILRHNVSGLPVVDDEGRLCGILSEFDMLQLLYAPDSEKGTVADYMNQDVLTVGPDDDLSDVADLFLGHRYRRLPVVRNGWLVGVVARRDLIRFIRDVRLRVAERFSKRAARGATASAGEAISG